MFENQSLYRLKVFCEVVKAQSFRSAAEHLNISQPAVSAHIRALEEETQVTLLERGRVSKPTEAGSILYDYAMRTLQQADDISQIMLELSHGDIGRLALGTNSTLARAMTASVFGKFKKENPGVEMILRTGTTKQICNMTLQREIDFGFVEGKTIVAGLLAKTIVKDEIVIAVGPDHPLASRISVTAEDISKYPFLIPIQGSPYHLMLMNLLSSHGIKINESLMQIEDAESIKVVLCSGMGVAALLRLSIVEELANGRIKRVDWKGVPIYLDLTLILRPDKYVSPLHNRFLKFFETDTRDIFNRYGYLIP